LFAKISNRIPGNDFQTSPGSIPNWFDNDVLHLILRSQKSIARSQKKVYRPYGIFLRILMFDQSDLDNLTKKTMYIGALPIVNHYLQRLDLNNILDRFLPADKRLKVSHSQTLLVAIRNILVGRLPLYKIGDWAQGQSSDFLSLSDKQIHALNDDRIGRSLDSLFDTDRASLMTKIVLKAISEFSIELDRFHNDSTSVTVTGKCQQPAKYKDKVSAKPLRGHSKDYRPDLKQLVLSLTISNDGAVPVHCKVYDGNVTDDKTHVETWDMIRKLAGSDEFIYVADSKLCTREQMTYIDQKGGKFVTIMPRTRKEDKKFRSDLKNGLEVNWMEVHRKRTTKHEENVFFAYQSPNTSVEGFRIVWFKSSAKEERDAENRTAKINKALDKLSHFKAQKAGKGKFNCKEQITKQVTSILDKTGTQDLINWTHVKRDIEIIVQEGRGRPGKNTTYKKVIQETFSFDYEVCSSKVKELAAQDGIFPIMSNLSTEVPMAEILRMYKYQPRIEKRHQIMKSVLEVAPVYLKMPHRMEALLFVYFVCMMIDALIERDLRKAMEESQIRSLPLYGEERPSKKPSTRSVFDAFALNSIDEIYLKGKLVKTFYPQLNQLQEQILSLINIDTRVYHPAE